MKKAVLSTVLLSGLVLSLAAPTAFAANTSEVEVKLSKDGYEEGEGPFKDHLAIVFKPISFAFKGTASDLGLTLNNTAGIDNGYLAVNEDRAVADAKGWELEGKLSALDSGSNALTNAKMTFKPAAFKVYNIGTKEIIKNGVTDYDPADIVPGSPAASTTDFTIDPSFELVAGSSSVKFAESSLTGTKGGVFTELSKSVLTIPGASASKAGTYNGQVTWTLVSK